MEPRVENNIKCLQKMLQDTKQHCSKYKFGDDYSDYPLEFDGYYLGMPCTYSIQAPDIVGDEAHQIISIRSKATVPITNISFQIGDVQ